MNNLSKIPMHLAQSKIHEAFIKINPLLTNLIEIILKLRYLMFTTI